MPTAARTASARSRTPLTNLVMRGWSLSGTSIVKRADRYAVVAYAGVDPETHRKRQKWFSGFKTRREADQFRLTLAHSPAFSAGQGPYGSPRLRTGDYLITWLHERIALRTLRARDGKCTAERMIRLYLTPNLGHIPLSRLSPAAIQQLYVALLSKQARKRTHGLSPATVARAANVLHSALEDAVKRGLIARNPQDNTIRPNVPPYEPVVLTPEQISAYLEDARETATPALYALYVTASTCGLRIGELTGILETNVDLRGRVLHVRQTLVRAGATPVFGRPKTTSGTRTVVLPDVAVEAIRDALRWKKEQRLRLGPKFRDVGLLMCGHQGRPLNPSNIRTRDHYPRLQGSVCRARGRMTCDTSTPPI